MSGSGDYIRRADAIEALYKDAEAHPDHTFWTTQHEALLTIPAADVRSRWIPVSERLIHSGWYLVACNEWGGSAVRKAIYDEATRKWMEFPCRGPKDITKFVTHCMPLPEPPKEE